MHGVRPEVIQGDDTAHSGRECRGNLRIAHIGNMFFTLEFKVVNLCPKGTANLSSCAREINYVSVGINQVNGKAVGLEPPHHGVEVLLCQPEPVSKFLRRKPSMEIRRSLGVNFINELLKVLFLLRRPP